MVTATLTSKGQLTIPKAVRDSLHLHTGDRVAFVVHGDDELGALVTIHQKLCDADINVSSSNGVTDGRGGYRYILHVHPDDYHRALEVLDVDQNKKPLSDFHLDLHRRFEAKG